MKKSSFWTYYLTANVDQNACSTSRHQCHQSLSRQRELVAGIVNKTAPKTIACLGSGYLNDIPIATMFEKDKDVFLVDWIPGISRVGVAGSIITRQDNHYHCLFCDKCIGSLYCSSFTNELLDDGVCTAFVPVEEGALTCKNYAPGLQPNFVAGDVTSGYSSHFAQLMENKVPKCKTPKDAFIKAIKACDQINAKQDRIPLNDHSMDFVTSSMVISQFDAEPYSFFSTILERTYGGERIMSLEKTLRPFMEKLRTRLFVDQVRHHVAEIYRLVNKNGKGRVFFSVELFRQSLEGELCFLVQDMPKALEIIGHYFLFDFDLLSESHGLHRSDVDGGCSVIQNYVLAPRAVPALDN